MGNEREVIVDGAAAVPVPHLETSEMLAIVESAPDGMVLVDDSGRMLAVNRRIETMFGYDRGELVGRPVEILVPESLRERHREHRAAYADQPAVREIGSGLELVGRRSDGSEFPIEVALSRLDEGVRDAAVIACVRDVTEAQALRAGIEAEQRRFERIFHDAPVAMTLTRLGDDGSRTIELANQAFADLLGRPLEQLVGNDFAALTAPEDRDLTVAAAASMLADRRDRFVTEKRYLRGDGSVVWVLLHSAVVSRDPDVRTLAHIVDITDRRARQAQRKRLELMEDRERIARGLHDLVIQRLFAAGMQLQAAAVRSESADVTDSLFGTIDELDATIDEIRNTIFDLHLDRTESGRTRTLLDEVESERSRLSERSTVVTHGNVDELPRAVVAEAVPALREMLSNVARHARAEHVEIRLAVRAGRLDIGVHDDGAGFGPEAPHGDGLDNLVARARAMGGSCTIESDPGGGTVARWSVPV